MGQRMPEVCEVTRNQSASGAIRSLEAVAVRVPRRAELLPKTAHGETPISEYVILRLVTESGNAGTGEVTTAVGWNGEEAVGSVDLIRRRLAPRLLGLDVADWASIAVVFDSMIKARPFLRAGLEMACLDAHGRSAQRSVASLLGEVIQERMLTKIVLPARDVSTVKEMAGFALDQGAHRLKVKVGTGLATDIERVEMVRGLHEGPLSVDANEGWDPEELDGVAGLIDGASLACVEQPFSRHQSDATRALRTRTTAPVLADESVWSASDVQRIAESRTFAAVSLYPGKVGGLRRFLRAAEEARARGLTVIVGSNLELGIGTAAMAHALAVTEDRGEGIGHDLIGPLYFEHPLVTDASFVDYAEARLPAGIGLGVDLDLDALARHQLTETLEPVDIEKWS